MLHIVSEFNWETNESRVCYWTLGPLEDVILTKELNQLQLRNTFSDLFALFLFFAARLVVPCKITIFAFSECIGKSFAVRAVIGKRLASF